MKLDLKGCCDDKVQELDGRKIEEVLTGEGGDYVLTVLVHTVC